MNSKYPALFPKDLYIRPFHFPLSLLQWSSGNPIIGLGTPLTAPQVKTDVSNNFRHNHYAEYTTSMQYNYKLNMQHRVVYNTAMHIQYSNLSIQSPLTTKVEVRIFCDSLWSNICRSTSILVSKRAVQVEIKVEPTLFIDTTPSKYVYVLHGIDPISNFYNLQYGYTSNVHVSISSSSVNNDIVDRPDTPPIFPSVLSIRRSLIIKFGDAVDNIEDMLKKKCNIELTRILTVYHGKQDIFQLGVKKYICQSLLWYVIQYYEKTM